MHQFQKFFSTNDFSLSVFPKKMSPALSRAVHVLILVDKLNYFKIPSYYFKNYFLGSFWDDFGSLGYIIRKCPFTYVSILFLSNVPGTNSLIWSLVTLQNNAKVMNYSEQIWAGFMYILDLEKIKLKNLLLYANHMNILLKAMKFLYFFW